jgi:hypothetical protein
VASVAAEPEAVGPALPPSPEQTDESLREQALELQQEMEADFPEAWGVFRAWWKERGFGPLSTLSGPSLQGAVIKLERDLDGAKNGPPSA